MSHVPDTPYSSTCDYPAFTRNEDEDGELVVLFSPGSSSSGWEEQLPIAPASGASSSAPEEPPAYQFSSTGHLCPGQLFIDAAPTPVLYSDAGQPTPATFCYVAGDFHVAGPSSIQADAPLPELLSQTAGNYFPEFLDPLPDNWLEWFPGPMFPNTCATETRVPVPPTTNTGYGAPGLFAPENAPEFQFQDLPAGWNHEGFTQTGAIFGEHAWSGLPSPIPPVPPLPTPASTYIPLPGNVEQFGQNAGVFVPPQLLNDIASILASNLPQTAPQPTLHRSHDGTEVTIRCTDKGRRVTVLFD